jgi:4-hydroxy-tetrahydrodipicolinate synthase
MIVSVRLFLESNPIPVKKALELMGLIGTGIRPPLTPFSTDSELLKSLQEALIIGSLIQ